MPKIRTRTQIAAEIHDALRAHNPPIDRSDSAIRRMAVRWHRREQEEGRELDQFEGLRILGITSDPTPREAIRNIEAVTA